jgi:hypothetical protein
MKVIRGIDTIMVQSGFGNKYKFSKEQSSSVSIIQKCPVMLSFATCEHSELARGLWPMRALRYHTPLSACALFSVPLYQRFPLFMAGSFPLNMESESEVEYDGTDFCVLCDDSFPLGRFQDAHALEKWSYSFRCGSCPCILKV